MARDAVLDAVDRKMDAARADLEDLVRIPSISADPDHAHDVRASADATVALLERAGLENVRTADVAGSHPYVFAEWMHAGDAPTVLLYAHHDVQPPGIVDRWTDDPFTPVERNGRLFGRGTADDKAGAVAHAAAIAAWLETAGELPCNVKVLVEGEEEIGSPNLHEFLVVNLDALRSDVMVLADAANWKTGVPGLTYSLRGLAGADISLRALEGPVHSGEAGGAVPDPVLALAQVLASLVDEHGDVAVDGIWDDVRALTGAERAVIEGFDDAPESFARSMGMRDGVQLTGDPTVPLHARLWLRPTITVIGIDGHPVKGSSNQIVSRAKARISMRLAPGQHPDRVLEQLRAHVEARVPWGLELLFESHEGVPAWECDPTGPAFDAAKRALRTGFGVDPVLMGEGGTIPFVGPFAEAFGGIPALLIGPNDPGNHIHGEDESLHLADWHKMTRSIASLLSELSENADALRATR